MTGLDKILKAIEDDAKAEADAVIAEAKKTADAIIIAAKQEADKKCTLIAEKSAADIAAVISRAESAAGLKEKKIILETKQLVINDIITQARNSLANLSDFEFTETILTMVKKFAHNEPGKILFSHKDKVRLTTDFNDRLKAALTVKEKSVLVIEETSADLDGGFLLVYGDIEENCTFEALFAAARDILQDKVNSLLFD